MRIRHARTDRRRIAQTVELPSERASLRALDSPHARCALSATWLVEGLLQYLDAQVVDGLFAKIDALSALGSTLLYEVVGESLLRAPPLEATLRYMRDLGAPWIFGSDDPAALVAARGWTAVITDPSVIGNEWKHWPFPAAPAHIPGIPRGYLVEAHKR